MRCPWQEPEVSLITIPDPVLQGESLHRCQDLSRLRFCAASYIAPVQRRDADVLRPLCRGPVVEHLPTGHDVDVSGLRVCLSTVLETRVFPDPEVVDLRAFRQVEQCNTSAPND